MSFIKNFLNSIFDSKFSYFVYFMSLLGIMSIAHFQNEVHKEKNYAPKEKKVLKIAYFNSPQFSIESKLSQITGIESINRIDSDELIAEVSELERAYEVGESRNLNKLHVYELTLSENLSEKSLSLLLTFLKELLAPVEGMISPLTKEKLSFKSSESFFRRSSIKGISNYLKFILLLLSTMSLGMIGFKFEKRIRVLKKINRNTKDFQNLFYLSQLVFIFSTVLILLMTVNGSFSDLLLFVPLLMALVVLKFFSKDLFLRFNR